jgi:predicted N-acetyltransferase YhbS
MITIRQETMRDVEAREALLDSCFGAERFQKTCERLREGRLPARGLSLVIERDGSVIGTVRLWHVSAGANRPALMLGPIAINPACQGLGLGGKLMREAISRSKALGHKAVVLVGDASYYERFGFSADNTGGLWMPGPYERERFLGLALEKDALDGARGLVSAAGALEPKPDLAALVAAASQGKPGAFSLAA